MRRVAFLVVMLGVSVGCNAESGPQDVDAARNAIVRLYADYRVAVESADIAGYVDALHPDVRLLPPGAPAIVGASNYAGFLEPVFEAATYKIEVLSAPQVEIVGDAAVAEYIYAINLTLKDPSQAIDQAGALTDSRTVSRYFDVLKQRADGQWAIWRHTWNVVPEPE